MFFAVIVLSRWFDVSGNKWIKRVFFYNDQKLIFIINCHYIYDTHIYLMKYMNIFFCGSNTLDFLYMYMYVCELYFVFLNAPNNIFNGFSFILKMYFKWKQKISNNFFLNDEWNCHNICSMCVCVWMLSDFF